MTLTDVVLSVPRPACDGSHSVIPCQRFSSGSTDSGFVCALSRLYSWLWQHGRIRGKNNQLRMMSQTDKKYLFPLRDSLLGQWCEFNFLILRGQGWNKWRVIYSPLIKTTLNFSPSPSLPSFLLSKWVISWLLSTGVTRNRCEWDSCWFLFSIENLVDGRTDDILFACEHAPRWIYSVSLLSKHLLRRGRCQIEVDTLPSST